MGLMMLMIQPRFSVTNVEGKGRGLVLIEGVPEGSYVLEYEGEVYPRREREAHEREYSSNDEGCYILDVQIPDGWYCIDATRHLLSPGRLMNHAAKTKATLTPILLQGKWRVGFTTTRDLHVGEELMWDYGCPPGGVEWLKLCPSKSGEHCACVKVLMNCTIPNTLLTSLCQQVLHPL